MFIAANRSQCGSMIYTFYMFYTDKKQKRNLKQTPPRSAP